MFENRKIQKFCKENLDGNIPVHIIDLCKKQGISYGELEMDMDMASCMIWDDDVRMIVVNNIFKASGKRYLLARELGYWVLFAKHKKKYTNEHPYLHRSKIDYDSKRKKWAIRFAEEILMPTSAVGIMDYLKNRNLGIDISNDRRISLTKTEFAVPTELAACRLERLGLLFHYN